jgi:hypothetical protein
MKSHAEAAALLSGKPQKRARKARLPASLKLWPVGILAVDTARNSGYAIYADGKYIRSGETRIDDHGVLAAIVSQAMGDAADANAYSALVLVLERPYAGNSWTLQALGAARQAWLSAWKSMGQARRRVITVYPVTWRARVLGVTRGETLPRVEKAYALAIKRAAQSARGGMGAELPVDVGDDEAPAIGIGKWASYAGEVGAVLPKKIREAQP